MAEAPALLSQYRVVGNNHSSLACGDVFVWIKTENAEVSKTATRTPSIFLTVHFRSVLDDPQPTPIGDLEKGIHIHRQPESMDDHDCLSSRRDFRLHLAQVHVPGVRITID